MVYYETVEYERFVSSRFGVNGVEKSTTRTVIPEVGVVVSTSGRVSKMADVAYYVVYECHGDDVKNVDVTSISVSRFLCLPAIIDVL